MHGLTLLNGADVKPRERRDCELRYLQNVLADEAGMMVMMRGGQQQQQQTQQQQQLAVQQTQQEQQQLAVQHPRLAELKAKYGQVRWVGVCRGRLGVGEVVAFGATWLGISNSTGALGQPWQT